MLGDSELYRRAGDALSEETADRWRNLAKSADWADFKYRVGEIRGLERAATILREQAKKQFGEEK